MSLSLPELDIPFSFSANPFSDHAEEHARGFVRRFGLVPTADAQRHFDESKLGILVGWACPRADRVTLELVADWMGCNLVLDDLFDETSLGREPRRLREFCDRLISCLPREGGVAQHDGSPFALAYTDLWQRTCEYLGPTWRDRFIRHFSLFLDRCVWEAENRTDGLMPKIDKYLTMRSCAFLPYIDLLEVTIGWEVPADVYQTELFAELNQALSESVLWTNDLYSCEKEYRLGDVHNMVVILHREQGGDLQAAADVVGGMVQGRIDRFAELSDEFLRVRLPEQSDPGVRAALTTHIANMRSWLSGQMRWRHETKRNAIGNLRLADGIAARSY